MFRIVFCKDFKQCGRTFLIPNVWHYRNSTIFPPKNQCVLTATNVIIVRRNIRLLVTMVPRLVSVNGLVMVGVGGGG